jgi:hypothetical protein
VLYPHAYVFPRAVRVRHPTRDRAARLPVPTSPRPVRVPGRPRKCPPREFMHMVVARSSDVLHMHASIFMQPNAALFPTRKHSYSLHTSTLTHNTWVQLCIYRNKITYNTRVQLRTRASTSTKTHTSRYNRRHDQVHVHKYSSAHEQVQSHTQQIQLRPQVSTGTEVQSCTRASTITE